MKLISAETIQKHTQTSGVRNEIDKILAPVLLEQRIYGLQILDPSWSWRKNAFNHICNTLLTTYVVIGTVYFMQNTDDISLLSEAIMTVIITVEYQIKLVCLILYRSTFRKLYVAAKSSLFGLIKHISPDRAVNLEGLLRKVVAVQSTLLAVPTSSYIILALWSWYRGTRINLLRTTSTLMPVSTPYYEIGLVLHLNVFVMVTITMLAVDFWFIVLSCIFCETCDSAADILQVKRFAGETDDSYADRLNQALRKFNSVHVKLIEYLNTLNVIYKWQLLGTLGGALAITCVILLVITEVPNVHLVIVMIPVTTELFAYNLMGEKIKSKASDLNMALVNFDWTSLRIQDKRSYAIITCNLNKGFCIRSAVGVDLSLLTLSSIYKGCYQIFAVLNTMK